MDYISMPKDGAQVRNAICICKQRVATVVAHELAHQCFGNLVTMEWWTHLWLNEGFATWVSYLAADGLFPEWKIWTQFLDESTEGLRLDGLLESHHIEVEINHAGEIDEIFDAISYRKGASVIRMLQSYLGAKVFQRALAKYIKKHACSNAKTEDLWAAREEESKEPVTKLMDSWTKQNGYPVVSVKLKDSKFEFEHVSSKVARIVADADNTLVDNIKMFFINLFQYSAESQCSRALVAIDLAKNGISGSFSDASTFTTCPRLSSMNLSRNLIGFNGGSKSIGLSIQVIDLSYNRISWLRGASTFVYQRKQSRQRLAGV
ncbi:hypothetical protein L2E82_30793 [Cichorium intybus]|uniref:Uncharacterized protein n=1 Tax=Cichorium intybus TaxID=13427 RepID=A0ACB9D1I7_CICIN|nr:hypothetical protein L2E82_30793 [Cichorium intybus]